MTSANLAKNRPGLVNIIYLVFSIMAVNSGVKCYLLATNGVLPSDLPEALFSFSHVAFFTAAIELKEYLGFGYQKSPEVA